MCRLLINRNSFKSVFAHRIKGIKTVNMKSYIKIALLFVFIVAILPIMNAQIHDYSKVKSLIMNAQNDSIHKIERLAALCFHKLINAYRRKNKLDTIGWDEVLWLTCNNHNAWMLANSVLSHGEKPYTKNFTGSHPGDRYNYASGGKGTCQWSGENALYHFSDEGQTITEIADNIALTSFEQWKHSKGHNQNMLERRHKVHGVAFCIGEGRVYGTDLFASNLPYSNTEQTAPSRATTNENVVVIKATPAEKRIKMDLNEMQKTFYTKLYSDQKLSANCKKNRAMAKASERHAAYMASTKKLTHKESRAKNNYYGENETQRLMKASFGSYIFKRRKFCITESIAMIEFKAGKINADSLKNEILIQLDKEHFVDAEKTNVGYGLVLKRANNSIKCYVTRLSGYTPLIEKDKTVSFAKNISNN